MSRVECLLGTTTSDGANGPITREQCLSESILSLPCAHRCATEAAVNGSFSSIKIARNGHSETLQHFVKPLEVYFANAVLRLWADANFSAIAWRGFSLKHGRPTCGIFCGKCFDTLYCNVRLVELRFAVLPFAFPAWCHCFPLVDVSLAALRATGFPAS